MRLKLVTNASRLADEISRHAAADETLRGYANDWRRFERWCRLSGARALPASVETLTAYLAEAANAPGLLPGRQWRYSPATLQRWVAGIAWAHESAGLPSPAGDIEVRRLLAGLRRMRASPPKRKAPVLLDDLEAMLRACESQTWPGVVIGARNKCILLLGWAGALRRGEIASLRVSDVVLDRQDGLHIMIRASKTDKEAAGAVVAIPYGRRLTTCGPCAWVRWAAVLAAWDGADGGPGRRPGAMRAAFMMRDMKGHVCRRTHITFTDSERYAFPPVRVNGAIGPGRIDGEAVAQIVRRSGAKAGLNPGSLAGHSLRAGFVTQALRAGASHHAIMRQTRHKDPAMIEVYARERAPLVGNAVTLLGL